MDLGQQGVMQTVSNQSVIFILRKNKAMLKGSCRVYRRYRGKHLICKVPLIYVCMHLASMIRNNGPVKVHIVCASQFIFMKSSSESKINHLSNTKETGLKQFMANNVPLRAEDLCIVMKV